MLPAGERIVPERVRDRYLPRRERSGIALCLSGGGYRAALFHLGGLRRLNELGALSRVDTFTSVSGGSIVAALLADRVGTWPAAGSPVPEWEERVAEPLRALTRRNIRTGAWLRGLVRPRNWSGSDGPVRELARVYERRVTSRRLAELPERPRFVLCATDMVFGVNWVFDSGRHRNRHGRAGDYQAGYLHPLPDWPLARAVAASSCFPPFFNPLRLSLDPRLLEGGDYQGADRDALVSDIRLSDGGVYDNLGLEPVWKDHATVLVSDGGATFDASRDKGLFSRIMRYPSVVENQARGLRKRWLIASFAERVMSGAYWGVGGAVAHYERSTPGYGETLVDRVVSEVRTDLDRFSEAEICVLENHGYLLAEAAIGKHAAHLAGPREQPLAIPHPEWMDEERVADALRGSHERKKLGRF